MKLLTSNLPLGNCVIKLHQVTVSQPYLAQVLGEAQHLEKVGKLESSGLPKIQKTIWRTKTPRMEVFLVSLERA